MMTAKIPPICRNAFILPAGVLSLLFVIAASSHAQYSIVRLYDFEEGTPGNVPSSVPDTVTDAFVPGTDDFTLGPTVGPLDFYDVIPFNDSANIGIGNFQTPPFPRAVPAPPLDQIAGSPTYVDISTGSGLENTAAVNLVSDRAISIEPGESLRSVAFQGVFVAQSLSQGSGVSIEEQTTTRSFNVLTQAWVRPDADGAGTAQVVFSNGEQTGGVSINRDGQWELSGLGPNADDSASAIAVEFDEWTHVAVLRTGAISELYVNGSLAAVSNGFFGEFGNSVTLGTFDSELDPFGEFGSFDGLIDNFSISGPANVNGFALFTDVAFFADTGVTEPTGLLGDVDQDNDVDQDDYLLWSQNVGFNNGFGEGDLGTLVIGDVDTNGTVDFFDFRIIQREAAEAGNAIVLVPEPTTGVLLLAGIGFAVARRRRQPSGEGPLAPVANNRRHACWVLAIVMSGATAVSAQAQLIVNEDFFYPGLPTAVIDDLAGFGGTSFGGGGNGDSGQWETRWFAGGAATIVTDDPELTRGGLVNNRFAVSANMLTEFSGVGRLYDLDDSIATDQTLYFGIDIAADQVFNDEGRAINGSFGILSVGGGTQAVPLVSIGITGPEDDPLTAAGGGTSTFFAQLGATQLASDPDQVRAEGDVSMNANDFTNDGQFHRLVGKIEINANGDAERLTAWLDPTGVETSDSTVLSVESDITTGWDDPNVTLSALVQTIDRADEQTFAQREHYFDNLAIGTTFESVLTPQEIPRLSLEVDTATGNLTLRNDSSQDFDLSFYQISSESGSLDPSGWNSLADQGVVGGGEAPAGDFNEDGEVDAADYTVWRDTLGSTDDLRADANGDDVVDAADYELWRNNFGLTGGSGGAWLENAASAELLIETNFSGSTTVAAGGGTLDLGSGFDTSGTQDLVVSFATSEGALGLLNVAEVVSVSSAGAVPEPTATLLLGNLSFILSFFVAIRRGRH